MIRYKHVYDISVRLGVESIDYPDDTPYSLEHISTIEDNGIYDLSKLIMSAHSGSHVDAPSHFIANARSIDQYPVQDFILPALVVPIKDKVSIQPLELKDYGITPGDALLFKTDNSLNGRCRDGIFSKEYVFMAPEAASFCVEKKVGLVGLDYITIEKYEDHSFSAHRKLLENDILILEGIDLKDVPSGQYTLFCLPLKIKGAEASPVRAILLR